jgi:RNA 3'-phosphate cyclase
MEFLEVDGSQGEGGGQVLRTAVAFSVIQGRPIRVSKIRAGREKPGLRRQHLSALRVLAEAFSAELKGAVEGSTDVSFAPRSARLDSLSLDMGTAASITLVLQAVIPAVALSGSGISLSLSGGTDVPWSPTFDYVALVLRKAYAAVGIVFEARVQRRGYYPRGGGRVLLSVEPCASLSPLTLVAPSGRPAARLVSRCASLPAHVSERQLASARAVLDASGIQTVEALSTVDEADSPGSSLLAFWAGDGVFIGSDSIGSRGRRAEAVGEEAASRFVEYARSGACVDSNMADMLAPILSLATAPSSLKVPRVTPHLETGLALAKQFTGCSYAVLEEGRGYVVTVTPR